MNEKSLICKYIKENPETWQKDFEDMHIRFSIDEHNFCIFKYIIDCDFNNPICREARGIIIDLDSLDVVGVGFDKFFNYGEQFASEIDWQTARVQEKLDGSIVKKFWNEKSGNWQWATNGVINAKNAEYQGLIANNYLELIECADNYNDIKEDKLDKKLTYIFELVEPNAHVVNYPSIYLYHIGTRENDTLKEVEVDIGIKKPKEYKLNSLKDCIDFVETLNEKDGDIEHEGFVVVDKNYDRIKIKSSRYLEMHYLSNGVISNKHKILELMKTDDINIEDVKNKFPVYKEVFEFYENEINRVESEAKAMIDYCREMYKENGGNRKEIAEKIKNLEYAHIGFKALGNDKTAKTILSDMSDAQYEKLIKDYKEKEPEVKIGGMY